MAPDARAEGLGGLVFILLLLELVGLYAAAGVIAWLRAP
jgi:hypothetical protein